MENKSYKKILEFIKILALEAGKLIVEKRKNNELSLSLKNDIELVTTADLAADQLIKKMIQSHYPDHRILSEELSPDFSNDDIYKNPLWIIDPIDGTVNYAHHHHQVSVSIAFFDKGTVQVGVVHSPFQKETFWACLGEGAFMNDTPIKVSECSLMKSALIATGFPYQKDHIKHLVNRLESVLKNYQDIRRIGSAALDICWVAMGRLEGYYETVKPWDMAAGFLIAQEAGALTGNLYPSKINIPSGCNGNDLVVATPQIFDHLVDLLIKADQSSSQ